MQRFLQSALPCECSLGPTIEAPSTDDIRPDSPTLPPGLDISLSNLSRANQSIGLQVAAETIAGQNARASYHRAKHSSSVPDVPKVEVDPWSKPFPLPLYNLPASPRSPSYSCPPLRAMNPAQHTNAPVIMPSRPPNSMPRPLTSNDSDRACVRRGLTVKGDILSPKFGIQNEEPPPTYPPLPIASFPSFWTRKVYFSNERPRYEYTCATRIFECVALGDVVQLDGKIQYGMRSMKCFKNRYAIMELLLRPGQSFPDGAKPPAQSLEILFPSDLLVRLSMTQRIRRAISRVIGWLKGVEMYDVPILVRCTAPAQRR